MYIEPVPNCCTAKIIVDIPIDRFLKTKKEKDAFRQDIKDIIEKYDAYKYKLLQVITTDKQQIAADILRKEFKFRGNIKPSRMDTHHTTIQIHYYIYR